MREQEPRSLANKFAAKGLRATKSAFADWVQASVRPSPRRRTSWRNALRRGFNRRLFLVLMLAPLLALAALGLAPTARADGGAPNLAYVSGTPAGISIIDLASKQVTGTVAVPGDPRGMVLSLDARFLYAALAGKNGVAVIDTLSKQVTTTYPTGPGPTSLTIDLVDPSHLWVANTGGNTVTVLNPDSGKKLATIPTGQRPTSVAIAGPTTGINETDGTSEVLVANQGDKTISVIGSESYTVLATVQLPEAPLWITVPGIGGTAYISTDQGHIYGLTLGSHQLFGPLFSGQSFHLMDYDALSGDIYVPDSRANLLNVLRPANSGLQPPAKLPSQPARPAYAIDGAPWAVAITSDGSLGMVIQHQSGDVTMLDVQGHKQITTIHVGGTPQAVLAGPYPPLVSRQNSQITLIIVYVVLGILLFGGIAWLVWWLRRQERRIRELHAQEDAEYERQLLSGEAPKEGQEQTQAPTQPTGGPKEG